MSEDNKNLETTEEKTTVETTEETKPEETKEEIKQEEPKVEEKKEEEVKEEKTEEPAKPAEELKEEPKAVEPALSVTPPQSVNNVQPEPQQQFTSPVTNSEPQKGGNGVFIVIIIVLVLILFAIIGIIIFSKLLPSGKNPVQTTTTTTAAPTTTSTTTTTTTTSTTSIFDTTTTTTGSSIFNTTTTTASSGTPNTLTYSKTNKAFTCTTSKSAGTYKVEQKVDYYFNNSGYGLIMDNELVADFGSYNLNQSYINSYFNTFFGSGSCTSHDCTQATIDFSDNSKYGFNSKATVNGNKITITYDSTMYKGSNVTDAEKTVLKSSMEKAGYTCN